MSESVHDAFQSQGPIGFSGDMMFCKRDTISRVPDQNGVSLLCVMLHIHHCGWEPSIRILREWKSYFLYCVIDFNLRIVPVM